MQSVGKTSRVKPLAADLAVIYKPIKDLSPFSNNSRTHSEEQISQIAASIHEFGFTNPILTDGENGIIAGHGRLLAAAKLGLSMVPTISLPGLTEAQKRAYVIADNKLALNAGWNFDILRLEMAAITALDFDLGMTGFTDDEIAKIMGDKPGLTEPDALPEVVTPRTKAGDLWGLDNHRLICGDSTDADTVSQVTSGRLVDCVFTSPPYAVGVDYGGYDDTIANLRAMLPKLAALWMERVSPGGFAVTNFGDIVKGKSAAKSDDLTEYPMALEYWPAFTERGWKLWSRRVWCKPGAGTRSMQCISSNRASTNWEHVWTWRKRGPRMFTEQITGDYPSQNGWFDTTSEHKLAVGLKVHGAGMPVTVAKRGIVWHSKAKGSVLEPFCGTGTTIIAAEMTGRHCYAIELNPEYVDIAVQRWENFTGHKAELLNGSTEE